MRLKTDQTSFSVRAAWKPISKKIFTIAESFRRTTRRKSYSWLLKLNIDKFFPSLRILWLFWIAGYRIFFSSFLIVIESISSKNKYNVPKSSSTSHTWSMNSHLASPTIALRTLGKLSKRRGKVSLVSRGWPINYRPPYNTRSAFIPLSRSRAPRLLPRQGVRSPRAPRKHIHKTAGAKPLYISRLSFDLLPPSLADRGVAASSSSLERRRVEFISTKPRETAGANHELRPITGIVTDGVA